MNDNSRTFKRSLGTIGLQKNSMRTCYLVIFVQKVNCCKKIQIICENSLFIIIDLENATFINCKKYFFTIKKFLNIYNYCNHFNHILHVFYLNDNK